MSERIPRCKPRYEGRGFEDEGHLRRAGGRDEKSRCPGWAASPELRQKLLDDAIVDPDGVKDRLGRPKRFWNAVNGVIFVATSTQEQVPAYNCYPDTCATEVEEALAERVLRSVEDVLGSPASPDPPVPPA
jgi:hypothetical protein